MSYMRTTITIRADLSLRSLLEERAEATGKTISVIVREILERALGERPMGDRIRHLRGTLARGRHRDDRWSRSIRARNWRP